MRKTKAKPKQNALASKSGANSRVIVKHELPTVVEAVERVLIQGDLSPLTSEQRVQYYKAVCGSLNLNPLTSPFTYILFREPGGGEKLQLYANKSCAEQLRRLHGVSVVSSRKEIADSICVYEVDVRDRTGRTDSAAGAVPLYKFKDGKRIDFTGVEWCNAIMKSHTKAKRRATLSICGLAFLDESELDGVQAVGGVTPQGRIYRYEEPTNGTHEAALAVVEKRAKEHKERDTSRAATDCLFYVETDPVEFLNVKAFGEAQNEVAQEGLRMILKSHVKTMTAGGGALVLPEKLDSFLKELNDAGVAVKKLEAA
jgi:hypothetical protein